MRFVEILEQYIAFQEGCVLSRSSNRIQSWLPIIGVSNSNNIMIQLLVMLTIGSVFTNTYVIIAGFRHVSVFVQCGTCKKCFCHLTPTIYMYQIGDCIQHCIDHMTHPYDIAPTRLFVFFYTSHIGVLPQVSVCTSHFPIVHRYASQYFSPQNSAQKGRAFYRLIVKPSKSQVFKKFSISSKTLCTSHLNSTVYRPRIFPTAHTPSISRYVDINLQGLTCQLLDWLSHVV